LENKNSGLYLLFIKVSKKQKITIRSGKIFDISPGYYIYIGSAKRNLSQRLKRHASKEKNYFGILIFCLKKENCFHGAL